MDTATADLDPFVHPALFYRGDHEYLQATLPFIRGGLAAGEPVAVAVPERNLRLLRAWLGPQASAVCFLDMTREGRNPGRIIPGVLRAFADPHEGRRVRIVGEPVWPGRSLTEYPACLQHEALVNLAFPGRAVTIMCPYDADALAPGVVRDAETTHPVLLDGSGLRLSEAYAPERAIRDANRALPDPETAETLTFGSGDGDPGRAREFAAGRASRAGLSGERLGDLRLIAGELVADSLGHGGGGGVLRVWTEGGQVVMDVRDAGRITDPLAGRGPVDPRLRGSRGLLVTNLLSDLVRVHTGEDGTTVRVYFTI
ncbi:anti-sigma factor RsbA family regulatory protein [Streptosporangium saharense]|uniref:Anti-sigma regulatory factor (Ser/Thr protein kinase) n=1 Tax=Streptosporangium saharense TaxID=1706840 RepID=A0A7W7QQ89_9ACTN|nr:sensor histidine kinase [Streptosporangium saharense]MBB4917720.1 anti-sigma regulatory factor (Ser/Thr protein kinase) [Streptosporangium saharense]